jgi:ferredoxin
MLKKIYPARYLGALMTNLPVLETLANAYLFMGDDVVYLPRDNTIRINEPIPQPEEIALPSEIVEHFIKKANFHWIMDFCLCRDGAGCRDYPREYGCLFLGEAVLDINPELGSLATKKEALDHVQRCQEAGLVHMVGRNRLDKVWLGAGPGHKLLTICNCCPCCCLYGTLPYTSPKISRKIHRLPGLQVSVSELCSGCGLCTEGVCFVEAINLTNGQANILDDCRGCGRCVEICPDGAIDITLSDRVVFQETVDRISKLVDVS